MHTHRLTRLIAGANIGVGSGRERRRQPKLASTPPGGYHVGHRSGFLLHLSVAVPHFHAVGHPDARREDEDDECWNLLSRSEFLSYHVLPQFGHQSDFVQRHVVQIPHGFPQSARTDLGRQAKTFAAPFKSTEYVQYDDDVRCRDDHQ